MGFDPPEWLICLIPIDFRSQEPQLGLALSFGNVDVPSARLRAGIAVPAVSPRLENILEVEGRVLRPDAPGDSTSAIQKATKARNARSGPPHRQQLDSRKTVVRPRVALIEEDTGRASCREKG